jgi:hypothetical protein
MGLIREPKNVDFTVLDKLWSDEERKEFSTFIKLRKEQPKKQTARTTTARTRVTLLTPFSDTLAPFSDTPTSISRTSLTPQNRKPKEFCKVYSKSAENFLKFGF